MLFTLGLILVLIAISGLYRYLSSLWITKRKLADLGTWVIITGCTDGIGMAYAKRIARTNEVDLLLVGRSESKINNLVKAIREETGFTRKTKTLILDFAHKDVDYQSFQDLCGTLEIGTLIHCAGISYSHPMYFDELRPEFLDELIDVNLRSAMKLIRVVLPQMKARNRGAIVCLGSGASRANEPLLAGYAAVKGALVSLCECLQVEYREYNLLIQCQTPLMVVSKMSKIRKGSITVPTADEYVTSGIRMIEGASISGLFCSASAVSPYWIHELILSVMMVIPRFITEKVRLSEQKRVYRRANAKGSSASKNE